MSNYSTAFLLASEAYLRPPEEKSYYEECSSCGRRISGGQKVCNVCLGQAQGLLEEITARYIAEIQRNFTEDEAAHLASAYEGVYMLDINQIMLEKSNCNTRRVHG